MNLCEKRKEGGMAPRGEGKNRTRRALRAGTVRVAVRLGLENTTIDAICRESAVNVSAVYRLYESKEALIAAAFADEDEALLELVMESLPVLEYASIDWQSRWHVLFTKCWDYLMAHPNEAVFYVRYYFSESFRLYAADDHTRRYAPLVERMEAFFPKTDVRLLLSHVLTTALCEAQRQILDGETDAALAGEQCFRLVYCVIRAFGEA